MLWIKYKISTVATDETLDPQAVNRLLNKKLPYTESNYQLALSEAYQGEVTVEDVPETADEIRAKRDKLLADTDWTQTLDAPIDAATREAMRTYRQPLRDVPQQDGFPTDVQWPELPETTKAAPDPVDTAFDALVGVGGDDHA